MISLAVCFLMVIGTQHTIASNGTASTDYECVGGCAMNTTRESKNETYFFIPSPLILQLNDTEYILPHFVD